MKEMNRKDVPLASVKNDELVSIKELERELGDKYYLIAYKKD